MNRRENRIAEILAEFMDDINEFQANVPGTPTKEDLAEMDAIYDDAIAKLDKEYSYEN